MSFDSIQASNLDLLMPCVLWVLVWLAEQDCEQKLFLYLLIWLGDLVRTAPHCLQTISLEVLLDALAQCLLQNSAVMWDLPLITAWI